MKDFDSGNWRVRFTQLPGSAALGIEDATVENVPVVTSTFDGYDRADWRDFEAWCCAHGLTALPAAPQTVALYIAERAETLKPASLSRRFGRHLESPFRGRV